MNPWRTVLITQNRFPEQVRWNVKRPCFLNAQKWVNKKTVEKSFSSHRLWENFYRLKIVHRFFDEKFFSTNWLFTLLHDASLKVPVLRGYTFSWFHIFRYWNYLIKGDSYFVLKKCGNTAQRKGRQNLPYKELLNV